MQITAEYTCAYCGETVETSVDVSAGETQSYVEDCFVCCRPNILKISVDPESYEAYIETEFEG